jgi:hypothetical protein
MAYNPFDDVIDNDPAYMANGGGLQVTMGGSEDATRGLDYLRKSGQSTEGYTIPQLEALGRIDNLKFPSSAYQKAAETLPPPKGKELEEYNNQFFTRKRFPGVSVAEVGKSVYDFLGKGTGPQVQEQKDRNKEILKRNTYQLPPDIKPGSREEALLIKKYEKEIAKSLKEQGYDDLNIGRVLQDMFFGEGKEAYDVMDEGTAYSDLPDPLKSGANPFWLLLDSLDVLTLGASGLLLAGGRKLTPKFIKFLKNSKKKKMSDTDIVTEAKKRFPEEFATIVTSNNTALEQAGISRGQVLNKNVKSFALGGTAEDFTQNVDLMSDRFMKDPAFEQEDAFEKSLEGATAFNPFKLHKLFKTSPGVATPKNLREVGLYNELVDTQNMGGADVGIETLLPTVKSISDNDFAFKSFTVDKLNSANAPKNATPESWRQFLKGGELQAPESELLDSGIEDFFIDSDKMYPGKKISKEQLIDIYNESPVGNIEIKVKDKPTYDGNVGTASDLAQYDNYVGRPRHENFGSAPIDAFGKNYREIVIQSGPIPNDRSPYVQSSHFDEPNVIGFTRVADYQNTDGQAVSVIQELQTDLLTTVNNEQQRLNAMVKRAKKQSEELNEIYNNPLSDANDRDIAQRKLREIKENMGGRTIEELENMSVTKPFPTNVGRERISSLQTDLTSLQDEINELVFRQNQSPLQTAGLEDSISGIQNKQIKIFDDLASMNREHTYEQKLKGVRVPNVSDTDITKELADYVESDGGRAFSIGTKELNTFPPVPFSRPGDYIDLLLKATIKDAQNKGIKKIAIMPADVGANKRWGKTGEAAKRFRDLYDKKMIQELKNIKKKYPGSELRLENIQDPSKPEASFFGKRLQADGTFEELSGEIIEEVPQINFKKSMDDEDVLRQIRAFDDTYGLEDTKAFVSFKQEDGSEIIQRIVKGRVPEGRVMQDSYFKLSDDYTTQDLKEAQFMFDEFNPQSVPMYVLDISTSSAQTGPMYLYRKKEGGTIDKDRLVSITDIYGSYGR